MTGFSPTQLKKYSQVRGENVKYVKFHHLVSHLKVKRKGEVVLGTFNVKSGQLQKLFGKKNHPKVRFGSKNSPQKNLGFSSKSVTCQVFSQHILHTKSETTNRCTAPAPTTGGHQRHQFLQGTAACTDSMVPILRFAWGCTEKKNHAEKRSRS